MAKHVLHIADELAKQRLINSLQKSPAVDDRGRTLVVVVYRAKQKADQQLPQKGLFYAWTTILADHVGCSVAEMKRDLKEAFLPMVESVNRITGEIFLERMHTEDLQPPQWHTFLTQIEVLAREHFEITLPPPSDPNAWRAYQHHQHAAAAA